MWEVAQGTGEDIQAMTKGKERKTQLKEERKTRKNRSNRLE